MPCYFCFKFENPKEGEIKWEENFKDKATLDGKSAKTRIYSDQSPNVRELVRSERERKADKRRGWDMKIAQEKMVEWVAEQEIGPGVTVVHKENHKEFIVESVGNPPTFITLVGVKGKYNPECFTVKKP